ncbi:MAG: MarR family winged helix-turn-helix transcriptional regulator [Mesorhizobium sp.]|nr:MarR family winged helix-turn-helix transcriptional regulator [Mesorhizobium sp.]MCO5160537.1 MarR family winged helix-turn-helix transcriptional regulator [Mesorhizobium sp.]
MADTESQAFDGDDETCAYRVQEQIGYILRKAHQRHVAIFSSQIEELTPPQFAALSKLGDLGECSQNQLGQLVAMDAATVKGVVDRLKLRGLVAVAEDNEDRRRIVVSLTPLGRDMLVQLVPVAVKITRDTLQPLTKRESQTLLKLLNKIS